MTVSKKINAQSIHSWPTEVNTSYAPAANCCPCGWDVKNDRVEAKKMVKKMLVYKAG
ncbi:hypothetical protein NOM01_00575 [Sporolactobacillus sp. STSJ-5]|uniref:hypothetical protein n=1 Tax=Sporolactobacillus sp. STSJ-5 TaxID=2965076 RepID=UPI002107350B|nr:hypothetical protein [Sporolactobacillus sp. STSJ-5]MCQ2008482.1 hypothetical protein [Sporolactobacillus sp. STSJ-5]